MVDETGDAEVDNRWNGSVWNTNGKNGRKGWRKDGREEWTGTLNGMSD